MCVGLTRSHQRCNTPVRRRVRRLTQVALPFQPATMSTAQLAAVSYLARYSGRTHTLYAFQLREWFAWCDSNGLDALTGIQRAYVELYIRGLGDRGLTDSAVNTMMHAVRYALPAHPWHHTDPHRAG